ncbi:hypothetical protein D4Q76_03300 [archaeon]|nr:MAG: hypothetical protein D4Q76_03300 [archaeon]
MEAQTLIGLARAFFIGAIGALITWILSGSSASIGIGVILFYLEATRQNNDAESRTFGAQKKKTFWHSQ